jgi:hypothetical protein
MASHVFNEFKRASAAGEVDLDTDDIRVSLHMTNTTIDTENDAIVTNTDFSTPDEMDGANYSAPGVALTTEAVNKDDANDRAEFDADDVTWSALGNGTREVLGVLVYKFDTSWAASLPIAWVEFAASQNPGGSDFTIQWNAEGILQLS